MKDEKLIMDILKNMDLKIDLNLDKISKSIENINEKLDKISYNLKSD
ncbi:hypothetical protein [Clostridium baratii]|uniref:Uncharacterized protein n=1 Tax=Clostridium baratii TaxID=1561 RepID=A0A174VPY8_9CLOT|nr:hypothetical protein [Clostridium baratii]CUQ35341.1 Uncharacterised protein [Clostridium baratii]